MDQKTRQRLCTYRTTVTPVQATVDTQDLVSWIVKGLAAVVMFLLALGAKDLKDRIKNAEERAIAALALASSLEARVSLLEGIISGKRKD